MGRNAPEVRRPAPPVATLALRAPPCARHPRTGPRPPRPSPILADLAANTPEAADAGAPTKSLARRDRGVAREGARRSAPRVRWLPRHARWPRRDPARAPRTA